MSTLLALFESSGIVDTIFGVIGTLLYPLFAMPIFGSIRIVQYLFEMFAGIGTASFDGQPITSGNSGTVDDTGILYFLMNHDIVKNLIISIMVLALFLMIIFTVMAFIKNAYSAKPKGWKDIIANSIKGLANFIFLPVCCLLGVWLGNILLQAINGATSNGGASSMDRKLFIACAYNANKFRCSDNLDDEKFKRLIQHKMLDTETYGDKTFEEVYTIEWHYKVGSTTEFDPEYYDYYADIVDKIYSTTDVDIMRHGMIGIGVSDFYSLWNVNYVILVVGGVFMLYVLGSLAFAMIRRLFIILVLFIISPGVCALYPLDDGKAVGSWAGEVKKQVLSAYGAVAGMNIFFSLLPLIDNIQLFSAGAYHGWGANDIAQIFILVVGLLCVKELIGLISGFVGGEDAYSKGSGVMKSARETTKKYATKTIGGAFRYGAAAKAAAKDAGGKNLFTHTLRGLGAAAASIVKTGARDVYNATGKDYVKAAEKGIKAGSDTYSRDKDTKKLNRMAKNYDVATDTDGFRADQIRALATKLGLTDTIDKKLAKANGLSLEDYRSNLQLTKDYSSKEKKFDEADTAYNAFVKALEEASSGDVTKMGTFKTLYGIDLSKTAGTPAEILKQVMSGTKSSVESMDVDKLVASGISRDAAIDLATSRKMINDLIDLKENKATKLTEAGDALIDAAKALKNSYKDSSSATAKTFTDSVVNSVKTAVDGVVKGRDNTSRTDVGDVGSKVSTAIKTAVNSMKDDNKKSAEAIQDMAKNTQLFQSELTKAIKKANEKE